MRLSLLGLLPLPLALAADLTLLLPPKPNPFALAPSTHATLSSLGAHLSAPLSAANGFVFRNVTPGSYLADVHCPTEGFHPLRIDVAGGEGEGKITVRAWDTFRGNEWANKGEELPVREGNGVEVRHSAAKTFFVERPAFSLLSILKNPMILMGLGSMGLVFGLPYLMDNMDPELRAEFEEHQRSSPMNSIMGNAQAGQPMGNFDMAAYLAGSNKKDAGSAAPAAGGAGAGAGRQQGVRR
ncbi:ER membrane protein complex subunit 7 [Escovopsis weberi]|uniref:ER membrane protein complex subunit 7 n=1 Tax=Escovopsis weberi TaxID=150374 RepID=A0A0M8N8C9_ESCWE|nr:ER membrane protein complex subunit 7 [Escovopsis weberi]